VSIAVFSVDELGRPSPAGPEGLVSTGEYPTVGGPSGIHGFRQICWPDDREMLLIAASPHTGQPADVAQVRLYELGDELSVASLSARPPARGGRNPLRSRLVGHYLHEPVLAANFGAPREFDAGEKCQITDWQTFLTAGTRLTEFLKYQDHP